MGRYRELILESAGDDAPFRFQIHEIRKAGERAAQLTQQLLAFSRRQVLKPQVLDPNFVIRDTATMLRRLLGENVEIVLVLEPNAGWIKVGPGQLQQVLINLTVNARDAMPAGGKLTMQTGQIRTSATMKGMAEPLISGPYVMLEIVDTGIGMDEDTRARIFEPFFTTKQIGKGTGLGLATVFGIISQSGGHITVDSRPGEGTTFRLFFPYTDPTTSSIPQDPGSRHDMRGHETILAVEDQPDVHAFVCSALTRHGYNLLEAGSGAEALDICRRFDGEILLLLTDVVMPGMSGKELAEQLKARRKALRVLYMSGYTDSMIGEDVSKPQERTGFIQKPLSPRDLLAEVRRTLDRN